MKVLKIETKSSNEYSVQIQDKKIIVWLDVLRENETKDFESDWNKYIFHTNNVDDMKIQAYQEKPENFIECSELAIEAIEHKLNS